MQIQKAKFSTGGYVLHKMGTKSGKGKASAWFDANGVMISAERFDSRGRSRAVVVKSPLWEHLQDVGRYYKD